MTKIVLNGCYGGFGLSEKACEFLGVENGREYECNRTDPKLVECVETLGEEADASYAALYIKEFDEYNYDYRIHEYDGSERIELIPKVHKKELESKTANEIAEYLISLGIKVVD